MSQKFSMMYMMRVIGVSQNPDANFPQVFEVVNKSPILNFWGRCQWFLGLNMSMSLNWWAI